MYMLLGFKNINVSELLKGKLLHCIAFHRPANFSYPPLGHLLITDRYMLMTIKPDQLVHHGRK